MSQRSESPIDVKRLKEARTRANLTQVQLASRIGLHPVTVAKWETGLHQPSDLVLRALARELDTTVAFLRGEAEAQAARIRHGLTVPPVPPMEGEEGGTVARWTAEQIAKAITLVEQAQGIKKSIVAPVLALLPVLQ